MAKGPKIKPVETNKEKGNTYKKLIETYNAAMEAGFYGEAELIVYAFMEDRLRSFLYHCNALDRRNSRGINEKMQEIYGECNNIDSINTKLDIIDTALKLLTKNEVQTDYANELVTIFRVGLDAKELRKKIKDIRKWTAYRNEIVHALFNKDMEDLRAGYRAHVEEGFQYARYLDKQVGLLKRT